MEKINWRKRCTVVSITLIGTVAYASVLLYVTNRNVDKIYESYQEVVVENQKLRQEKEVLYQDTLEMQIKLDELNKNKKEVFLCQ